MKNFMMTFVLVLISPFAWAVSPDISVALSSVEDCEKGACSVSINLSMPINAGYKKPERRFYVHETTSENKYVPIVVRDVYFFDSGEICTSVAGGEFKCKHYKEFRGDEMKQKFEYVCKKFSGYPKQCPSYGNDQMKF